MCKLLDFSLKTCKLLDFSLSLLDQKVLIGNRFHVKLHILSPYSAKTVLLNTLAAGGLRLKSNSFILDS